MQKLLFHTEAKLEKPCKEIYRHQNGSSVDHALKEIFVPKETPKNKSNI